MTPKIIDLNNLSVKHVKLLNAINKEIKSEYHELVEQVYAQSDKSIDWLVNSLLSRNNYLCNVFLDFCYLELVKKVVQDEHVEKVIVKSRAQKKVLIEYFHEVGLNIAVDCSESFPQLLKGILEPYYNILQNIKTTFRLLYARDIKRRGRIPRDKSIILIDTFFVPAEFDGDVYVSRHYPKSNFYDYISKADKRYIYFVPEISVGKNIKRVINIAENSEEQFLYKQDYLKFKDYLYALFSPLRIKKIDFNLFRFKGINVRALLRSDFYRNISNSSSYKGILNYLFFKRIKEHGLKLKLVVNWFENQVIDRGFNKGLNDYYPLTDSIGYEPFIVSFDYNFYLQPTELERRLHVIPQRIAVVGKSLIDEIKKFCPQLHVETAPAFRFNSIFSNVLDQTIQKSRKKILVALPISIEGSFDILTVLKDTFLDYNIHEEYDIDLKAHPELFFGKMKDQFRYVLKYVSIVNEAFHKIIQSVDLVISNTSSVCMEALAYGISVVIVGSYNGLNQNPIPDLIPNTVWDLCYTSDELIKAINRFLTEGYEQSIQRRRRISENIKNSYFTPITKENIRHFLDLR